MISGTGGSFPNTPLYHNITKRKSDTHTDITAGKEELSPIKKARTEKESSDPNKSETLRLATKTNRLFSSLIQENSSFNTENTQPQVAETAEPLSSTTLLELSPLYFFEKHTFKAIFSGEPKTVHLYPNSTIIKQIVDDFGKEISSNKTDIDAFFEHARKSELFSKISIEKDTTLYISPSQITNQIVAFISGNSLQISGNFTLVTEKKYMFVIDKENRLLIQKKKRESKHGAIHHSSLVGGDPVKVAGIFKKKDEQTFVFENLSGHYQPKAKDMDCVIAWFQKYAPSHKLLDDRSEYNKTFKLNVRRLTIQLTSPSQPETST